MPDSESGQCLSSPRLRELLTSYQGAAVAGLLALIAIGVAWAPAAILLAIPMATALAISVKHEEPAIRVVAALFAAGFGLALVPEFLYIQDSFGNRMNTVFKLGFQAWIFLGVAAGVGGLIVVTRAVRWRGLSIAGLALLVIVSSPYVALSASDWTKMGIASGTLDGSSYLETLNPGEATAIDWLAGKAAEGDIMVEASGCAYQSVGGVPMNRFSAFTGVPTILGWVNHERQWRRGEFDDLNRIMSERSNLVDSWLAGRGEPAESSLTPRFIVMGTIERNTSEHCPELAARGPAEISALQLQGWEVAFEEGGTAILVQSDDPILAR